MANIQPRTQKEATFVDDEALPQRPSETTESEPVDIPFVNIANLI